MTGESPLTHPRIFRFYYPLALSWVFMSLESPISIALISRMALPKENTAVFLMLMGLALWIESPVIDLLSTSTTLCRDRQSFAVVSRFVWTVMAWCTVAHAVLAFTPLYDWVVRDLLSQPQVVVEELRVPFALMIPWSAFIGWRRYRQGILIRTGRTRSVGLGTGLRLTTMTIVGFALYLSGGLSGASVAACALIASVGAEAIFAHWASREAVRELPEVDSAVEARGTLTIGRLARFHLPLTATTMVMLSTFPVIGKALAQSSQPVLHLAAWQVASTLVWMHRTVVFALPEVVIALYRSPSSLPRLRSFSLIVGAASTGLLALLWATRLDVTFFTRVLGTKLDAAETAHQGIGLCLLLPVVGAMHSYARGSLTARHQTMPRLIAVFVGSAVLVAGLWVGLQAGWEGVVFAAFALTAGALAEWAVLGFANVQSLRREPGGGTVSEQ